LQVAQEIKRPLEIGDASKILFESYKLKGNYAKALEYHELYKQTQDSLFSTEKSKAIANLETQAEMDKKQLEIDKQQLEIEKEKEATKFQQYINYLVIAGLLSVLVFAFFIFRSRQKERKAKELVLQQKEEIQQINEELNTTLSIVEQERAKSDKLLLNILPIETARELKETGQATPQHYDLVSVLFTDFKGFTSLAEKMTPSEVIENLDTCFYALDLICDKYNLEKIKTIGDSYMCAGGLPVANTSNPMDTVLAGLEMQAFMTKWKSEKEAQGLPAWELRLGIHSGEAVAGVVGKNKFAYDIWGDTVNLASRMESSGEVGKVNISEMTYNLVKHQFQCTYRGEIQAKNKGEVKMYFVEGEL
jgi:class 3 adenylate cyclase